MGIPFLTLTGFMIQDPNCDCLYHDHDIRVELHSKSVIGTPYIAVTKNCLIFEKEIAKLDAEFKIGNNYYHVSDIKNVYRSKQENAEGVMLTFDFGNETVRRQISYSHGG